MSDFTWAAKANDIPSGEGRVCEVKGVAIALFNVDGTFHALDNTCIHR
ncbi:MAG: Rieske 2Fe-2S domain-containing protein, partial [Acidobacteriota bacterium]|nr:Rieske 2Fe-2S domain-containing protein [Acidobacteriota bacterium]